MRPSPWTHLEPHHPHCLQLWKPLGVEIPRPPAELVGDPKRGVPTTSAEKAALVRAFRIMARVAPGA